MYTICSKSSHFNFFFFKQKTAYEMRISDWSSDVCSSDLAARISRSQPSFQARTSASMRDVRSRRRGAPPTAPMTARWNPRSRSDRKSVVEGKSVSVRVDLGGRRIIKKKKQHEFSIHRSN